MSMSSTEHLTEWIPGTEAARRIGLSARYLIKLAERGLVRHEWTPLGRLYDPADVERLRVERAPKDAG